MIYESLQTKKEYPKKEDFVQPSGCINGNAYDSAVLEYEIHQHSSYGVWKDEETGEVLFKENAQFIPGSYYHDSGQGEWETTYTAYIPLKEGQTAKEAYQERMKWDKENHFYYEWMKKLEPEFQSLSHDVKYKLAQELEAIKKNFQIDLENKLNAVKKRTLYQEGIRQRIEKARKDRAKRKEDPLWESICQTARVLVRSNQKNNAKMLVKSYLEKYQEHA